MNWQRLKTVSVVGSGFLTLLAAFFAIMVYASKYGGSNGNPGPIKVFLDTQVSLTLLLGIL